MSQAAEGILWMSLGVFGIIGYSLLGPGREKESKARDTRMAWWQMINDKHETRESHRLSESIEAMRQATEAIDKKLGDAYPNGLVSEIEDIKKRLQYIEGRVHFLWDHRVTIRR